MINQIFADFGNFREVLYLINENIEPFFAMRGKMAQFLVNIAVVNIFKEFIFKRIVKIEPELVVGF